MDTSNNWPVELLMLVDISRQELEGSRLAELAAEIPNGNFKAVLLSDFAQQLFKHDAGPADKEYFHDQALEKQLRELLDADNTKATWLSCLFVGIASLNLFLQANVTGPPLKLESHTLLLPKSVAEVKSAWATIDRLAINSLRVEGETAYHLTPHPLLFVTAKTILNYLCSGDAANEDIFVARWWRFRVNLWHQRMLSETTSALHDLIFDDLQFLRRCLDRKQIASLVRLSGDQVIELSAKLEIEAGFANNTFGFDNKALLCIEAASKATGLQYVLTGRLGKRTKFQEHDVTQLVVLARSRNNEDNAIEADQTSRNGIDKIKPKTLELNDDTLLESISFSGASAEQALTSASTSSPDAEDSLQSIDPSSQPPLTSLDASILLLLASTIKEGSPSSDGISREQMLPYADRVLMHSRNWEVHTVGLIVKSRLEGYRSRTVERSVLQLQAVVDQVIAETSTLDSSKVEERSVDGTSIEVSTFLPRATEEESAPVEERLQYAYQLYPPTRWELEAELANRWVSLGGLRTALEIYERLEMWPEVALCYAAVDKEDKARQIVKRQLYEVVLPPDNGAELHVPASEDGEVSVVEFGAEKEFLPSDAPRLFCILGDIDNSPSFYERAWEVSNKRYSRAQRALGKFYFSRQKYAESAAAYRLALSANPLHATSWFALGCCGLELEDWETAVESFSRCTQIDDKDAESWANLASAILKRRSTTPGQNAWRENPPAADDESDDDLDTPGQNTEDEDGSESRQRDMRAALSALKHATGLKRDSWRMWENLLFISSSLRPKPSFSDMVIAFTRIVDLRAAKVGESCIDVNLLEMLVRHIITSDLDAPVAEQNRTASRGLPKMVSDLLLKKVVPVITSDARLWKLVSKFYLYLRKPSSALAAAEKGFRATSNVVGITDTETGWNGFVDSVDEIVAAYESIGPMERTEGLASGEGALVEKDWRFKARSAVRGVMGKGKAEWEGSEGWERLQDLLDGLKA